VAVFTDLIETERSTISNRSIKLFTLSGIYHATQNVLAGRDDEPVDAKLHLAAEFWNEVAEHIPDWKLAKQRKVSAADLRRDYIHAHTLALVSLGRAGNELLRRHPRDWKSKLGRLKTLDWSRNNAKLWEGRAMNAGRLSKRGVNVVLTGNLIKKHLGLKLTAEEQALENDFLGVKNGQLV
jgi:DNA sulfur modification protein DndB